MIEEFVITNLIQKKGKKLFGFARRIKDAEEVFIPPHVAETNKLNIHDKIYASTTPSHNEKGCSCVIDYIYDETGAFSSLLEKKNNPIRQSSVERNMIKISDDHIKEEVRKSFQFKKTFFTTKAVTNHIFKALGHQISSRDIGRVLDKMHSNGEISAVKLNRMQDQARASKTAYGGIVAHSNFIKIVTGE
jgi:hypothetical protein